MPDDVKNLFQYITRYKPQNIDLETKLKPFIPDYIPSIGGIDEFIKVPRPDGKPDFLGLKVRPYLRVLACACAARADRACRPSACHAAADATTRGAMTCSA